MNKKQKDLIEQIKYKKKPISNDMEELENIEVEKFKKNSKIQIYKLYK